MFNLNFVGFTMHTALITTRGTKMKISLKDRWLCIFNNDAINVSELETAYDIIVSCYSQPHRAYHTLKHIEHMLDKIDNMTQVYMLQCETDKKALYLATWFHDIVYSTNESFNDNEILSANYARNMLVQIGITDDYLLQTIHQLILSTKHHAPDPHLPIDLLLQEILIDADLSILGDNADIYNTYVNEVTKEWSHLESSTFRTGRVVFLTHMLNKNGIFHSEYMRELYGEQSILNMKAELSNLDKLNVEYLISTL